MVGLHKFTAPYDFVPRSIVTVRVAPRQRGDNRNWGHSRFGRRAIHGVASFAEEAVMDLNDLLHSKHINPSQQHILVVRHRPTEPKLRGWLPWLAAEKPDIYNAYQQSQRPKAENAVKRAQYVASFIGNKPGEAIFVGLYRVRGWKEISYKDYWRIRANRELRDWGMTGFAGDRPSVLWFDLKLSDAFQEWKGKLIVRWPNGRAWC